MGLSMGVVEMLSQRQVVTLICAVSLGIAVAELIKSDPLVRLIPADVLRDFPGKCYSWTSQKWYAPNDTWSLKPFCGKARCVALRNTKTNATFLGEEVTDCGLIIDLEKTTDCQIVEDQYDAKAEYPTCCPVYKCPEGTEITYKNKAGNNKK